VAQPVVPVLTRSRRTPNAWPPPTTRRNVDGTPADGARDGW